VIAHRNSCVAVLEPSRMVRVMRDAKLQELLAEGRFNRDQLQNVQPAVDFFKSINKSINQ
jgi:predicted glycosyl hydrolase (DUF1957 family)